MALTHYREKDRMKWVGVRPGHYGEQIIDWGDANNGITTVYTVPNGYTLFITHYVLQHYSGGGNSYGVFQIHDSGGVLESVVAVLNLPAGQANTANGNLFFPIEIEGNKSVRVRSNNANGTARLSFHGFLVDDDFLESPYE